MAKRGPYKPINYEMSEKLSRIQCTVEEIAMVLGVTTRTLQRNSKFRSLHQKGIDSGKASLRRHQWALAEQGHPTMLIWLGKQYLGQTDRLEQKAELTGKGGLPIQTESQITHLSLDQDVVIGAVQALAEAGVVIGRNAAVNISTN